MNVGAKIEGFGTEAMSLTIKCARCPRTLDEPGGLLFGPPDWPFGKVDKYHLCRNCYFAVQEFIRQTSKP